MNVQLARFNLRCSVRYARATSVDIFRDAYNYLLIAKMRLMDVARGTQS